MCWFRKSKPDEDISRGEIMYYDWLYSCYRIEHFFMRFTAKGREQIQQEEEQFKKLDESIRQILEDAERGCVDVF